MKLKWGRILNVLNSNLVQDDETKFWGAHLHGLIFRLRFTVLGGRLLKRFGWMFHQCSCLAAQERKKTFTKPF